QISARKTGSESEPVPSASLEKSMSDRPASAMATTIGGEAKYDESTSGWIRPGKLRLPDRTATTDSDRSRTCWATGSFSGPEFPMQVPHPKPVTLNPRRSRDTCSPECSSNEAAECDPGVIDVLVHQADLSPRATAFRAKIPAATMDLGLEVLVQLVIEAMTTSPLRTLCGSERESSADRVDT